MATNEFKTFATGAGANVMSQADWEALPALSSGFTSGKASSAEINKALRQSSSIASTLAQFISDTTGANVLDDGNAATLLNQLKAALLSAAVGRLVGMKIFTTSGTYTPTSGTKYQIVEAVGGGAGGGGCSTATSTTFAASAGGGAGSYAKAKLTISAPVSITIGSAGNGGAGSSTTTGASVGGAGGTTSVGTLLVCPGGNSGLASVGTFPSGSFCQSSQSRSSNSTGGNIFECPGEAGENGMVLNYARSGKGGSSPLGSGGAAVSTAASNAVAGNAASGYGSGGSGAVTGNSGVGQSGGNGTAGIVIIWEYS